MQNPPGIFIVIEGSDGSGKGTQFELLKKRLEKSGYKTASFDFPRYEKPSSHFVRRYLRGDYGPASAISPYAASLFFALDRYEAGAEIATALSEGHIVLSNRYVGSNMAHQGSKFKDEIEKRSFFVWEDSLEFQLLNIPRPNLNIFLKVPADVSYKLIGQKAKRSYTDKSHDEHEADMTHLTNSVETYDLLCQLFPRDYKAIDCVENGNLLDIEAISDKIWQMVTPLLPYLPESKPKPKKSKPVINNGPAKQNTQAEPDNLTTNLSLAAAFELIRLGFNISIDTDSHWNGSASQYRYHTPEGLSAEILKNYKDTYISARAAHKQLVAKLIEYFKSKGNSKTLAARNAANIAFSAVPLGAVFSVSISPSQDITKDSLTKTKTHPLPEISGLFRQLQRLAPQVETEKTEQAVEDPESINEILELIGPSRLPQNHSVEDFPKLVEISPKNELELLADHMYSFSDLSRDEILSAMEHWNYDQKSKALRQAMALNPSILSLPYYRVDSLADRISLAHLMSMAAKETIRLQPPTTRYGYEVDDQIEAAGAEDIFLEIFDSFLGLFSAMQAEIDDHSLEYATLAGHRIRWQGRLSAADVLSLCIKAANKNQADFAATLLEKIKEVHPLISEYINASAEATKKKLG